MSCRLLLLNSHQLLYKHSLFNSHANSRFSNVINCHVIKISLLNSHQFSYKFCTRLLNSHANSRSPSLINSHANPRFSNVIKCHVDSCFLTLINSYINTLSSQFSHPRSQGLTADTTLPEALAKTKMRSDLIGRMKTMECGNWTRTCTNKYGWLYKEVHRSVFNSLKKTKSRFGRWNLLSINGNFIFNIKYIGCCVTMY
jgi:hypothetical protein